jgi:hypothetical protein
MRRFIEFVDWAARFHFIGTMAWAGGSWAVTFFAASANGWDPVSVWMASLGAGGCGALIFIAFKARRYPVATIPHPPSDQPLKPNSATSPSIAKIIFGTGHPFETVVPSGVNRSRTVRVKIENNTNNEISNGTIRIANLDPPQKEHRNFFLKGDLTIGPHRHTFVDVAAYNEGTSQALPGTWIRLLVPIPAGYLFNGLPGNLPVIPHTFQLTFSTLENGVLDEAYCRLSVDQNHILHLENWGDSTKLLNSPNALPADIGVSLNRDLKQLDDYRVVCAIDVENNRAASELDNCLVEITEFSGTLPDGMKMPATLRSADQIQGNCFGRFKLSKGQRKPIPIFFVLRTRKNEWFFIDERGKKYPLTAQPTRVVLHIYGGKETRLVRLFIDVDAGWNPFPRLETVTNQNNEELTLFEAATRAYEQTKDKPISILATTWADSSDAILVWYCGQLAHYQNGRQPLVTLRGTQPPSRLKDEIDMAPLNNYVFVVESNSIILKSPTGSSRYENLSVSVDELDAAIRELAEREV